MYLPHLKQLVLRANAARDAYQDVACKMVLKCIFAHLEITYFDLL